MNSDTISANLDTLHDRSHEIVRAMSKSDLQILHSLERRIEDTPPNLIVANTRTLRTSQYDIVAACVESAYVRQFGEITRGLLVESEMWVEVMNTVLAESLSAPKPE